MLIRFGDVPQLAIELFSVLLLILTLHVRNRVIINLTDVDITILVQLRWIYKCYYGCSSFKCEFVRRCFQFWIKHVCTYINTFYRDTFTSCFERRGQQFKVKIPVWYTQLLSPEIGKFMSYWNPSFSE